MWKKTLKITAIAVSLLVLVLPFTLFCGVALADTSAEVTITATGYICDAPGGFVVTYISDYEVGLSWTKGVDAENTMVRACIGRYPESRTDGYEVYYGTGTSATDWVNMEFLSVPIYYQAWSQRADGIWEEGGSEPGWVEGITVMLLGLIFLALGLTIFAFVRSSGGFSWASAGAWFLLMAFSWMRHTSTTDIYFYMFFLFLVLMIVSIFGAIRTRPKKEVRWGDSEAFDDEADDYESDYPRTKQSPHIVSKAKRKRRPSRFSRTGEL